MVELTSQVSIEYFSKVGEFVIGHRYSEPIEVVFALEFFYDYPDGFGPSI